jgi:hypothetical protein
MRPDFVQLKNGGCVSADGSRLIRKTTNLDEDSSALAKPNLFSRRRVLAIAAVPKRAIQAFELVLQPPANDPHIWELGLFAIQELANAPQRVGGEDYLFEESVDLFQ